MGDCSSKQGWVGTRERSQDGLIEVLSVVVLAEEGSLYEKPVTWGPSRLGLGWARRGGTDQCFGISMVGCSVVVEGPCVCGAGWVN
ncbi:hypothetical protein QR685DRAFT_571372 [Neurospora intermedia]|uniref:Uncharacterized protein n=1 Tax=Neurospora intermedia TaxID=5142 RepID=A0ABR3DC11_NEUIN